MVETSDLEAFEKELMGGSKENSTDQFLRELESHNQPQTPTRDPREAQDVNVITDNGKTVQVKKNVILSFMSDTTGCGHIRNIFPMSYLNALFGKTGQRMVVQSPLFIHQHDLLVRAKTIFFQRQMTPSHLDIIKQYKAAQPQYQFKMVWDIDDFIWGKNEEQGGDKEDGVPSYNFGSTSIGDDIKKSSVEIMNLMDICTFSTPFLANYAKNVLGVKPQCIVLPNAVPQFFFGNKRRAPIKQDIKIPKVIYTGSPTHYSNEKLMLGDFDNAWKDWVIKSVNSGKIEFTVMGGLPWFFEEIKDKITIINWVDSWGYANTLKNQNADFGIAPLTPNNFNYSKSDIKQCEYAALGIVGIGSTFTNGKPSPYDGNIVSLPTDCTVEDIDKVFAENCKADAYNDVRSKQYDILVRDGRYLESSEYVNNLVSIY